MTPAGEVALTLALHLGTALVGWYILTFAPF